jgi:pimeloyl-ACP methyl ester carboxylesterase/class 3 adenylate cyclase
MRVSNRYRAPPASDNRRVQPETRYAKSGDVNIAYQVLGEGPHDLVFVPGFVSNVELGWSVPGRAEFLYALASFARVIQFDKRGTGMSDRVRDLPTLETRMDDVRAVMDAARSERAALFGVDTGGTMSVLFSATYPERTTALVLYGAFARMLWAPDHPWGLTEQEYLRRIDEVERSWGEREYGVEVMRRYSPSLGEEAGEAWSGYLRQSASPGAIAAYERMNMEIDVRPVLPAIHTPTLVVHRTGDKVVDIGAGRFLAERIPGARFIELPGEDHSPFTGGFEPLVEAVEAFLGETWSERAWDEAEPQRVLATVLFTDIVGSTAKAAELGDAAWRELLERHHSVIRRQLGRFRGKEIDTAGDGFFASFDGPARAIHCASSIVRSVQELGLEVRAGLHTGECELLDGKVGGIAIHIGARVSAEAKPGEVLVSGTVKDLVAGSGIEFRERGTAELKGVPGEWSLFAVEPERPA